MRHTGAGGLACSSTVEVNVLVLGEILELCLEVIGFDADRTENALRAAIVIPVAADVDDLHPLRAVGRQTRCELLNLDAGHDVILADRKSTRLNSSHVEISYAVFCLKKK